MFQQAPSDLEQRLFKLQAQLDRLSLSIQQWQQAQDHLQPMELRLSQLMQQSTEILDRLAATDTRHSRAVGEVESRLTEWAGFEQRLAQEWSTLRQQMSQELQSLIADLRGGRAAPGPALSGAAGAWPLEGVLRLHDELRAEAEASQPSTPRAVTSNAVKQLPESAESLAGRVESLERAVSAGREDFSQAADRNDRQRRRWYVGFGILAIGVILVGAILLGLQRRVDAQLSDAAARVAEAKRQADAATALANQKVTWTEQEAERQVEQARRDAQRAQAVSGILAAPDLVRFTLTSDPSAPRAYSHLLWSRSRGFVFSGSRIPPVAAPNTYQLWLITSGNPVSAGVFVPDATGTATLVVDKPVSVPRPVLGASVTVEPAGGSPAPSSAPILDREPPLISK
jgi:hypothetical protein